MPRTLSIGSTGSDVVLLQNTLNIKLAQIPLLKPDGIFGPKTLARVKQFQRGNDLVVDGVVGPKTWSALLNNSGQPDTRTGCDCGQHDQANQGIGELMKSQLVQLLEQAAAAGLGAFDSPDSGGGTTPPSATLPVIGGTFKAITAAQIAIANPIYGSSLDYTRIFTTDKTGAQNRPFTIAVPHDGSFIQVMNLGPSPDNRTVIHELMHCWQSQHSATPARFMAAAISCQASAVAKSTLAAVLDTSVTSHKDSRGNSDFPDQYPFSAYAYLPGSDLDAYGAEQAANAVESGDATVRATVKGAAANSVNAKNESSLKLLSACGDRRNTSMVF